VRQDLSPCCFTAEAEELSDGGELMQRAELIEDRLSRAEC